MRITPRSLFRLVRKAQVSYTPLVEVTISRSRLIGNFQAFQRQFSGQGIAPVLKSNAYGHGLVLVASLLEHERAPFFIVDTYVEALVLRNEGIRTPILIIGYTHPENIKECRLKDVAFTITNIDDLRIIACDQDMVGTYHVKIDTGMHRQGILVDEIPEALDLIAQAPHMTVEGICTHLADADGETSDPTDKQIGLWNEVVDRLQSRIPTIQFIHASATEGSRHLSSMKCNVIRLGMGLYGCTRTTPVAVQPVLEMTSLISSLRRVPKGECIGYNFTYEAPRDMIVATVPTGYAEGIDRRLSNIGAFLVRGFACPIVGRVSMNITSIDVTDGDPVAHIGERVTVISREYAHPNSCESIARQCNTIPYEILVHISAILRRTIV